MLVLLYMVAVLSLAIHCAFLLPTIAKYISNEMESSTDESKFVEESTSLLRFHGKCGTR